METTVASDVSGGMFFAATIAFVVALLLCGLLSLLETSITTLRLFKLKGLASRTGRYKKIFDLLERNPSSIINAILIANNAINVIAATSGGMVTDQLFAFLPRGIGFSLSVFTITMLLVVFGEIVPKNIARVLGDKLFGSTLWLVAFLYYALYPFVFAIQKLSQLILTQCTDQVCMLETDDEISEEELRFLINYIDEKGLMEPTKSAMLKSIFRLAVTSVDQIMVPIHQIVSIDVSSSIEHAYALFSKHQFSRIPVYEKTPDHVIGILHFKDLFLATIHKKEKTLKALVRATIFMPQTSHVNDALSDLKEQRIHMGMVVNEYGSLVGLVTLEDVIEEIVGEIYDEYEMEKSHVVQTGLLAWLARGDIALSELGALLGVRFEGVQSTTLGGFVTEHLAHIPKRGETVEHQGFLFTIKRASKKRVLYVQIKKL